MAHQASVNGGPRFGRPAEGVLSSIGDVGGDVVTLAELQAKLTLMDAKEAVGRAAVPVVGLVAVAALLVASLPVLLIGLAFVLAAALSVSQGTALLIVGLVAAALGAGIGYLALTRFLKSFESFRRSNEELARNIQWVRTTIAQSAKPILRSR